MFGKSTFGVVFGKNFNNTLRIFNDPQGFQECLLFESVSRILRKWKEWRSMFTIPGNSNAIFQILNDPQEFQQFQSAKEFEEFPTHQENGEAYLTRENFNKTLRTANDPQELQECPNVREVQSCSTIRKNGAAFATIRKR